MIEFFIYDALTKIIVQTGAVPEHALAIQPVQEGCALVVGRGTLNWKYVDGQVINPNNLD